MERSWVVTARVLRRHDRRYFQARCPEGVFEIYQDLKAGTWHLRRARIQPAGVGLLALRPAAQRSRF